MRHELRMYCCLRVAAVFFIYGFPMDGLLIGKDYVLNPDRGYRSGDAMMIRRLYEDQAFSSRMGKRASNTALQYMWERNGRALAAIFEEILRRKSSFAARALTQEL